MIMRAETGHIKTCLASCVNMSGELVFGPVELASPVSVLHLRRSVWKACGSPFDRRIVLCHGEHILKDGEMLQSETADNHFQLSVSFKKTDCCVKIWGCGEVSGDYSHFADKLASGVVDLCSAGQWFAALKQDGSVVPFMSSSTLLDHVEDLQENPEICSKELSYQISSGIVSICSVGETFLALKNTGATVAWQCPWTDDDCRIKIHPVPPELSTGVVSLHASQQLSAFVVVKTGGQAFAWDGNQVLVVADMLLADEADDITRNIEISLAVKLLAQKPHIADALVLLSMVSHQSIDGVLTLLEICYELKTQNPSDHKEEHMLVTRWGDHQRGQAFAILTEDNVLVTWGFAPTPNADSEANEEMHATALTGLLAAGLSPIFSHAQFRAGQQYSIWMVRCAGIAKIVSNMSNFAALRESGSILFWGDSVDVGLPPELATDVVDGVKDVFCNQAAFAAVKKSGAVVSWGTRDEGGDSTAFADELSDGVIDIVPNGWSFAAIKDNGDVVTWGCRNCGGGERFPGTVKKLYTNRHMVRGAFVGVNRQGGIVAWGCEDLGGDIAAVQSELSAGVVDVHSNGRAFAAIKDDGTLVTWPAPDTQDAPSLLRNIAKVCSIDCGEYGSAFAAMQDSAEL